ncbi:hypothetical protein GGI05_004699, partial [Coemansia sp. RSA 2603]
HCDEQHICVPVRVNARAAAVRSKSTAESRPWPTRRRKLRLAARPAEHWRHSTDTSL